jgi:hypothetical protein
MRGTRWQLVSLLAALGLFCVPPASHGQTAQPKRDAPPKEEAPETEMLKDLEFFRQTDLAKDREFFRMLHLFEKIPLRERFWLESTQPSPRQPGQQR